MKPVEEFPWHCLLVLYSALALSGQIMQQFPPPCILWVWRKGKTRWVVCMAFVPRLQLFPGFVKKRYRDCAHQRSGHAPGCHAPNGSGVFGRSPLADEPEPVCYTGAPPSRPLETRRSIALPPLVPALRLDGQSAKRQTGHVGGPETPDRLRPIRTRLPAGTTAAGRPPSRSAYADTDPCCVGTPCRIMGKPPVV